MYWLRLLCDGHGYWVPSESDSIEARESIISTYNESFPGHEFRIIMVRDTVPKSVQEFLKTGVPG